jgi:hypothetical protein
VNDPYFSINTCCPDEISNGIIHRAHRTENALTVRSPIILDDGCEIMNFNKTDGRLPVKNTSLLITGITCILLSVIVLFLPTLYGDKFTSYVLFGVVVYFIGFSLIMIGSIMIYYAFQGTMSRYFMTSKGKCSLSKNSNCSSGDCRKCVFADTYLRNNLLVKKDEGGLF